MISTWTSKVSLRVHHPPVVARAAACPRGWAHHVGAPCGAPLRLPTEDVPDQVWGRGARSRQRRKQVAGKCRIARGLIADAGTKETGYHGRGNQCKSHLELWKSVDAVVDGRTVGGRDQTINEGEWKVLNT